VTVGVGVSVGVEPRTAKKYARVPQRPVLRQRGRSWTGSPEKKRRGKGEMRKEKRERKRRKGKGKENGEGKGGRERGKGKGCAVLCWLCWMFSC
jgi:hypothetical protein